VVEQRAEVGVGAHVHAPALPPRPAVGAALGDEFFATERRGAGATWAADDVNDRPVYEHGTTLQRRGEWGVVRDGEERHRGLHRIVPLPTPHEYFRFLP